LRLGNNGFPANSGHGKRFWYVRNFLHGYSERRNNLILCHDLCLSGIENGFGMLTELAVMYRDVLL